MTSFDGAVDGEPLRRESMSHSSAKHFNMVGDVCCVISESHDSAREMCSV
jgi:hypothetical protein